MLFHDRMRCGYVYDSEFCFQFDLLRCVEGLVLVLLSLFLIVIICYVAQAQRNLKFAKILRIETLQMEINKKEDKLHIIYIYMW